MSNHEIVDAQALADAAQPGVFLNAEIIHPTGGRLRATGGWYGTSLNCNPADETPFIWNFEKLASGGVAISTDEFSPQHLYASVRDDADWYLQLQAPNSNDWIVTPQRDETLTVAGQDMMFVTIAGFNGKLVALDSEMTGNPALRIDPPQYGGFRVRSNGESVVRSCLWFVTPAKPLGEMVMRSTARSIGRNAAKTVTLEGLAALAAKYPES